MKAFLLVGGLGTRLRPITNTIPKCLVKIAGKSVIDYWIAALYNNGIIEILINLHHFPEMVKEHLVANFPEIKFSFFYEKDLLGSAGTIHANYDFIKDDKEFLVIYGDNFTDLPLYEFINFNKTNSSAASIALFSSPNPSACGIVELNENGIVIDFVEKPAIPKSNLANAGMYIFKNEAFKYFLSEDAKKTPFDIGFHILPNLIGKMSGWRINNFFIDIGNITNLTIAREYQNSCLH